MEIGSPVSPVGHGHGRRVQHLSLCIFAARTRIEGDADLYTSEYCTTFKIWENRFTYIRIRYYMPNRNYVHHAIFTNEIIQIIIHQTIILHGKQEYCTTLKSGILYITENRSLVQNRKQEFCTTQKKGILCITNMMSVNGSCVVSESLMYRSLF